MSHLPRLSGGVRRDAGVGVGNLWHSPAVFQMKSIQPSTFLRRLSAELAPTSSSELGGPYAALDAELPIWGKYCGPGHGDSSHCSPNDPVDAVCCRHDLCYGQRGYFDCGCDCDLVRSMPDAIIQTDSEAGKAWGTAAISFFANSPCLHHVEVCVPKLGCHTVPIPDPGGSLKCVGA